MGTGNADMLRVARQLRGFQQQEAADHLGVSQGMLSRIENKLVTVSDEVVQRASSFYQLPASFFSQTDPVLGAPVSVHPMWRRKASVSGREMDQIVAELNVRLMHLRRLLQAIELEATHRIPRLSVEEYDGDVEQIAALVRAHWQLPSGPIQNLTRVVEGAGVVVAHSQLSGSAVDGVTFSAPGLPPLVVLNSNQPGDRMRFTLAHELGHLVMHHTQPTKEMEKEANTFASCFLMPTRDIRTDFERRRIDLRLLAELKPVWRASMASLLMRAASLNLVNENQQRYLWQQFNVAKIRLAEPPELAVPMETGSVPAELIEAHRGELGYSLSDLAAMLSAMPTDLRVLYGLQEEAQKTPHLRLVK